jgi:cell division protein FtsL
VQELREKNNWINEQRESLADLTQSILEANNYEEVLALIPKIETDELD